MWTGLTDITPTTVCVTCGIDITPFLRRFGFYDSIDVTEFRTLHMDIIEVIVFT